MIREDLEADMAWLLEILTRDHPSRARRPELTEEDICEKLWERDYPQSARIYPPAPGGARFGVANHRQEYARALIAALVLAEDAEQTLVWFSRFGEKPAWRATEKAFKAAQRRAFMQADYAYLETRALAALVTDPNCPPGTLLAVSKNRDPHEALRFVIGIDPALPEKDDE